MVVTGSFLLTGLFAVAVLTRQTTALVDRQHRVLHEERVAQLVRQCGDAERRVQASPSPDTARPEHQRELLETLHSTYLAEVRADAAWPLVLDGQGRVLLRAPADLAAVVAVGPGWVGEDEFREVRYAGGDGLPRWAVAARYAPWDWTVVWSAPVTLKHREVQQLRTLLLGVLGASFTVFAGLLYLLLRRTLQPVVALTDAAASLARGEVDSPVVDTSGDEVGALVRAFAKMRDAVHRQMAAVRLSEKQYRDLVESANSVILRWDRGGRVIFMNRYGLQLFGFTAAELVGRHVLGSIVPDTAASGRDLRFMIQDILSDPARYELNENENICKDGRRVRIQWTNRAIFDEEGGFQELLSVGTDITERELLKSDLRRAQKMEAIGTLAGGVAHDFNNILAAIVGHADYAALRAERGGPVAEALHQVLQAAERARDLVQQILTFSRRTEQEKHPLELAPVVKEALKLLRSSIPTTIEIRENVSTRAASLADPTQIHQVVMNLCTNAYQAMAGQGGVLTVDLQDTAVGGDTGNPVEGLPPGQYLVLEVRDTGQGMAPATREKIFEPYFTTKGQGEGSGLGLAVVDGIVADHQGAIQVDSVPGQGTAVRVYLPAVPGGGQGVGRPGALEPVPGGCERILFVDDEESLRTVARRVFGEAGYRIEVCADGRVALDVVRENPSRWDLVVTDMSMPGLNGEELLAGLRGLRPDLPVILNTGYGAAMNRERAQALGADGFFPKPLAMSELARRVRRILDRQGATASVDPPE